MGKKWKRMLIERRKATPAVVEAPEPVEIKVEKKVAPKVEKKPEPKTEQRRLLRSNNLSTNMHAPRLYEGFCLVNYYLSLGVFMYASKPFPRFRNKRHCINLYWVC